MKSSFAELSGAGEVKVGSINTGTSNDISLTVTGDDPEDLQSTATRVQTMLATTEGLGDVTSDLTDQRPLLQVKVDRTKAADLGFTSSEVGQVIATALRGTKVGTVVLEGESRDLKIKPQDAGEASPGQIARLELPVSQLQQQQAIDKATKRLEAKQDDLKADGDALSAQGDDLGERQEALGEAQKAYAAEQQAKGNQAASDQRAELRKSRVTAAGAVADAQRSLRRLLANPPVPPPSRCQLPPAPAGTPVTPEQLTFLQACQRAEQAGAQYQQQLAQLEASVAQGEAQLKQLNAQIDAGAEQADESAAQQAQQDAFSAQQEALSDEQKQLTKEQKALSERQSDLGEEQADLADVRARAIRVSDIAEVKQELAPSAVTQIDGTRAVTLTATPTGEDLGALTATVQGEIDSLTGVPASVSIELGGASDDQAEAFRQLGLAMLLAIVIVFLIMVATFRSLVQPLVLLTSIPFAATGAVAGLLITDTALGVPAMVGLLMLIGIVVTNAIVLIDLINQKRAGGEDVTSAIVHGAGCGCDRSS